MKYFIVLALCLSAVVAEELHDRGVNFHTLHYSQHHQTLEEAKRKIADVLDGQHADFEEVGTYGGLGGAGVGTVGYSGQLSSDFGASSGSNAEFSSSAASNFGASHAANYASSSTYGSNANSNYASGLYGSGSHHSGSHGVGSVVIPVVGGATSSSNYLESSAAENVQQVIPEVLVSGGVGGHESFVRHEEHRSDNQVATPLVYTVPAGGSEKYYHHEERRVSNAATPIVYTVPSAAGSENYVHHEERRAQTQTSAPLIQFAPSSSGGSENYVHHEERRVQNQAVPTIQYISPSAGSERYVHVKEEQVQQTPLQLVVSSPAGGQESFMKYRKVTTTATQPQVVVHTSPAFTTSSLHQNTASSTSGSHLGALVTGGLTSGANSNYKTGYYGNSAYTVPAPVFGSAALTSANSNSLFKTGFGASHQAASNFGSSSTFGAGHQAGFGTNSAYTDSAAFGSKFGSQAKFGSAFGAESKFGSQYGSEAAFGSGSLLASSGSTSGLHNYMHESERLAKLQAQGMSVGGTRAGGTQYAANLENANSVGFGGLGGLSGVGAGNAGYKTKSWEKASKWSSQSEFGPDGQVNNYKELSTGESENYDINGRRAGYRAATTTLDDNGKVSSYSLHT